MKRIILVVSLLAIISTILLCGCFVEASYGKCTFIHGNEKIFGFGKTISTQIEDSMKNIITVAFSDANESYTKVATVSNSSYCIVKTDSLFNRTGAHSCDYYVNGSLEHRSTAVWPFDFTLPFH